MKPRLPQLREDVANAITFHPGNRTGTPEQRHPVSLMLADAVLRVVRPCSCDGDLIECSHEAARGQVEEENRKLRAERDALKAAVSNVICRMATLRVWAYRELTGDALHHVLSVMTDLWDILDPERSIHPALDPASGTDNPQEDDRNVPDRIDYDHDGELDDVVVNNCMAHLERLDTGRWYLGLYGNDGRTVQIDIASKTGRAEVTGFVKYSEGIAPDLERWAKSAPERPQDARTTPDPARVSHQTPGDPKEDA